MSDLRAHTGNLEKVCVRREVFMFAEKQGNIKLPDFTIEFDVMFPHIQNRETEYGSRPDSQHPGMEEQ